MHLSRITFHRSLTPAGWTGKPWGITFSDGSDKSYGAVVYFRWETEQGVQTRLVESKAKLTPLDQKGEPVKAEICGAVFATRLRRYIEKHSRMKIERWFHLLDSQTVLGAIQRDSYGYQTFFANRVGEIQKSAAVEEWWWIPGDLNIADIITRGATSEDLKESSLWQNGPHFLKLPVEEWPKKSAREVAANAKDGINKLQRKAFSAAITRAQAKREHNSTLQDYPSIKDTVIPTRAPENVPVRRPPDGTVVKLIDVRKFSSLTKLIRIIAWVWRAAVKWKRKSSADRKAKWEDMPSKDGAKSKAKKAVLSVRECQDALRDLLL